MSVLHSVHLRKVMHKKRDISLWDRLESQQEMDWRQAGCYNLQTLWREIDTLMNPLVIYMWPLFLAIGHKWLEKTSVWRLRSACIYMHRILTQTIKNVSRKNGPFQLRRRRFDGNAVVWCGVVWCVKGGQRRHKNSSQLPLLNSFDNGDSCLGSGHTI